MKEGSTVGIFLAGLMALPISAQQRRKAPPTGRKNVATQGQGMQVENPRQPAVPPAFVIGPDDVLDISVWKEPSVSRSVPVRPDGKISLPLVKDIQAAGLTPLELGESVAEKLRKFLTDPQVTVTVTAINSQKAYVVGEVTRPGPVNLLPGMTVLQALASAGGLTQFANQKRVYVLRAENGKEFRYPFNYKAAVRGDMRQNIVLKPGDTIIVP